MCTSSVMSLSGPMLDLWGAYTLIKDGAPHASNVEANVEAGRGGPPRPDLVCRRRSVTFVSRDRIPRWSF